MDSVNRLDQGETKNRLILVFSDKYSRPLQDGKDIAVIHQRPYEDDSRSTKLQHLVDQEQIAVPAPTAAASISGSSTLCSSVADTSVGADQIRRAKQERKRAKAEARRCARALVARAWEAPRPDDNLTLTPPDPIQTEQERHYCARDRQTNSSSEPSTSRHQFPTGFPTGYSLETLPKRSVFKLPEVAELVERLVEQYGTWSIGFLDSACNVFLTADSAAAISFKRINSSGGDVAVIFGDPLCPTGKYAETISEFKAFCRKNRMLFGFVGAGEAVKDYAIRKRWPTLQFASERMVNPESNPILNSQTRPAFVRPLELKAPETYSPDTQSRKPMRLFLYAPTRGHRDVELEIKAQAFYDEWCVQKGQAAHATTLGDLFALSGVMTYIYTKSAFDSSLLGLVAIMKVANGGYLLDPVIAHWEAPSCTTDFLRLAAMAEVKKRNGKAMSFGAEPRPEIQQISGMVWPATNIARRRHRQAYDALGLAAKRHVPQKFALDPDLERPLYLVMAKSCVHVRSILCITAAICAANNVRLGKDHQPSRRQRKTRGPLEIVQSATDSSGSSGSSMVPSATSTSTTSFANTDEPKLPPKLVDFVLALQKRDIPSGAEEEIQQQRMAMSTLESFVSLAECSMHHTRVSESSESSSTTVVECVSWCFRQLDSLDEKSAVTYAQVNRIYFRLGRAYKLFCEGSESISSSEQQYRFTTLCKDVIIHCDERAGTEMSKADQSALQKRLSRARKFLVLVDVFGISVLDSVPEVSVTRVDALRVNDLHAMAEGSCMKALVESIRRQQDTLFRHQDRVQPFVLGDSAP
ncbi:hypothetical protein QFC21_003791 [Naganishia friedmannii]|uniref:Uncharacterized protein n=1 Tax=Naganishia friedmannii TaxID=89922 RepID=A0ACC2VKW0_9TREE|nr:hypothetical protein QFC21_003791 [Naganishia friedmannii]